MRRKPYIAALIGIGVIFVAMIVNQVFSRPTTIPEGFDTGQEEAFIVGEEKLLAELDSIQRVIHVRKDLYIFAKTAYPEYANTDNVVDFIVSDVRNENQKIVARGKFGSSNHSIMLEIVKLNRNRVSTTILDKKTNLSINNLLPSNSLQNQFIGKLPIETKDYVIDYLENSETFTINIFNTTSNRLLAEKRIMEELKIDSLDSINLIHYGVVENQYDNRF